MEFPRLVWKKICFYRKRIRRALINMIVEGIFEHHIPGPYDQPDNGVYLTNGEIYMFYFDYDVLKNIAIKEDIWDDDNHNDMLMLCEAYECVYDDFKLDTAPGSCHWILREKICKGFIIDLWLIGPYEDIMKSNDCRPSEKRGLSARFSIPYTSSDGFTLNDIARIVWKENKKFWKRFDINHLNNKNKMWRFSLKWGYDGVLGVYVGYDT